jgi:hypothetical protein
MTEKKATKQEIKDQLDHLTKDFDKFVKYVDDKRVATDHSLCEIRNKQKKLTIMQVLIIFAIIWVIFVQCVILL